MKTIVIIPARFASERFPGKPLKRLSVGGSQKSLIKLSWEAACKVKNVEEVLADLCGRFPELKQNLYEDEGSIRNFINIYVNDEDIRYADGMQTGLKDGDRIQIVPSIAGGY